MGIKGLSFKIPAGRRTKFGNVPTHYDSPTLGSKRFDSKFEASLCSMLDAMKSAGQIITFIDQVSIPLGAETESGKRRMMRVDFLIIDLFGRAHFWDAKGMTTAKWGLQKDLAWKLHQIDVKAVKKGAALPMLYEDEEMSMIKG